MLLQKISLLKLSELKQQRCPDTPTYAECNEYRKVYGFNYWKGILKMSLVNNSSYMSRF